MKQRAFIIILTGMFLLGISHAHSETKKVKGQTVYVPVYSHVYYGNDEKSFLLSCMLNMGNTDSGAGITILSIEYLDTAGRLVYRMIDKPVYLRPMENTHFVIKESDTRGGAGAKFVITWQAEKSVSEPLVEAVMLSARGGQGISFSTRGIVLQERTR
jgi:hypothetical protein